MGEFKSDQMDLKYSENRLLDLELAQYGLSALKPQPLTLGIKRVTKDGEGEAGIVLRHGRFVGGAWCGLYAAGVPGPYVDDDIPSRIAEARL